ncbi:MAG TPA: hypothetical protein VIT88_02925 [Pyrinomonadaceae bacterium]
MTYLTSLTLLLLMLAPVSQDLPPAFHKLPEQVQAKATLILTGTFVRGRGPCIFMADGSRRWPLESRFQITKVYRGQVGGKTIYISSSVSPEIGISSAALQNGMEYLVLLRPSEESMKAIKAGDYIPAWDALDGEEVVAIVKLR